MLEWATDPMSLDELEVFDHMLAVLQFLRTSLRTARTISVTSIVVT